MHSLADWPRIVNQNEINVRPNKLIFKLSLIFFYNVPTEFNGVIPSRQYVCLCVYVRHEMYDYVSRTNGCT